MKILKFNSKIIKYFHFKIKYTKKCKEILYFKLNCSAHNNPISFFILLSRNINPFLLIKNDPIKKYKYFLNKIIKKRKWSPHICTTKNCIESIF